MKKRLLSIFLVISTLLSLCCISVYAKAPGVTTLEPEDITEDSAVLRGTVTSNSGIRIKEYGFQLVYQGNVSTYRFYDGEDYEYPNPINNDIIEYEVDGLRDSSEYAVVFYAVNYDGEKNFGKSVYFETYGDNEEPEITKLKSSAGNEFEEGTEVTFSASAEDNNEVEKIYIFIDGEVVAKKSSDSVKYTTDELEPGEHEIAAMAVDASGNESDVEYLEITVTEQDDGYYNSDYYEDTDDEYSNNDEDDEDSYIVQTPVKLSTPNAKSDRYTIYEGETVTVSWDSVANADYYTVWDFTRNVPYDNITSTSCYNIAPFNEEGTYAIGVYARSYENNLYLQSEACTFNITVEKKQIQASFVEEEYEDVYYENDYYDEGHTDVSVFHNQAYSNASYYGGIKVYVNGSRLDFDVEPEINNGRTMVPLRAIFEALGATVQWNNATSTVNAYRDDEGVELTIGSYYLYTSNGTKSLDQPGYVTNGRTLVPVRAISEAFNCDVKWYQDKQLVSIVAKDKKYQTVISNGISQNNADIVGSELEIYEKLTSMMNGTAYNDVYKVGTVYTGPDYEQQCKGFARTVHNKLFGYDIGSTKSNDYEINISNINTELVGQVTSNSDDAYKKMFMNARAGDFVQMERDNTKTNPHSAIVYSVDDTGVTFYEANTDGKNGIKKQTHTWSELNQKNKYMSVYTAVNYKLQ